MKQNRKTEQMTTIYLDMDGVIAKFFERLASDNGVTKWTEIPDVPKALDNIKGTNFFFGLDEYETATDLLAFVSQYDWGICSSPLTGDEYNSAYHKRRWLEDLGYMPKIQNLIFTHNKEQFATNRLDGRPNVLVDDKPTNCKKWRDQGGIAIRYQANEDSLTELIDKITKIMENLK
jgi:5'(3')-deoxyribonucleotidase